MHEQRMREPFKRVQVEKHRLIDMLQRGNEMGKKGQIMRPWVARIPEAFSLRALREKEVLNPACPQEKRQFLALNNRIETEKKI